jgi:hypothetical protein
MERMIVMNRWLVWSLVIGIALVSAACQPTNQTRNDAAAAQQLQPNITGYTVTNADSIVDTLTTAGAGAALANGAAPVAAAIAKAEAIMQCMQGVGAVDARIYVESNPQGVIPESGASIVLNQTRFNQNLLSCLTTGQTTSFAAQAVTLEPCTGTGTFTYQNENFTYLYVGVGDNLCGYFANHFESIKQNNQ